MSDARPATRNYARAAVRKPSLIVKGLLLTGLVVVVALAGLGCGGGVSSSEDAASSRCEPLPVAAAKHLGGALYGARLVDPVTVRSDDEYAGWRSWNIVAARVGGQSAVWAMDRLGGYSLIISINDHAYNVSHMGRGQDLRDPITEDADGVAEALSCVPAS